MTPKNISIQSISNFRLLAEHLKQGNTWFGIPERFDFNEVSLISTSGKRCSLPTSLLCILSISSEELNGLATTVGKLVFST